MSGNDAEWEDMPIDRIAHIPLGDLADVFYAAGAEYRIQWRKADAQSAIQGWGS